MDLPSSWIAFPCISPSHFKPSESNSVLVDIPQLLQVLLVYSVAKRVSMTGWCRRGGAWPSQAYILSQGGPADLEHLLQSHWIRQWTFQPRQNRRGESRSQRCHSSGRWKDGFLSSPPQRRPDHPPTDLRLVSTSRYHSPPILLGGVPVPLGIGLQKGLYLASPRRTV